MASQRWFEREPVGIGRWSCGFRVTSHSLLLHRLSVSPPKCKSPQRAMMAMMGKTHVPREGGGGGRKSASTVRKERRKWPRSQKETKAKKGPLKKNRALALHSLSTCSGDAAPIPHVHGRWQMWAKRWPPSHYSCHARLHEAGNVNPLGGEEGGGLRILSPRVMPVLATPAAGGYESLIAGNGMSGDKLSEHH